MSLMWAPGSNDPIYRPRRNEDPVPRWKYNGVCALAWILGALLVIESVIPEIWRQLP
jgi:hypothetical protein